ncbi:MAG: hypothetical protein AAGI67_07815 [Pseudomonadota bacterium]
MLAEATVVDLMIDAQTAAREIHGPDFYTAHESSLTSAPARFQAAAMASASAVVAYSEWLEACGNTFNLVSRAGLNPVRPKKEIAAVCEDLLRRIRQYASAAEQCAAAAKAATQCALLGPQATSDECNFPEGATRTALLKLTECPELRYVREISDALNDRELLDATPSEHLRDGLSFPAMAAADTNWPPKSVNKFVGYEWEQQVDVYRSLFQALNQDLAAPGLLPRGALQGINT